jgi:tetratricopeptide (TPR) repeat protein
MESMNDWTRAERHAQRAQQYFKHGQWNRALAELRAAVRVNPHQSDWHFGMGMALEALQRHEEALDCFQRVLTLRGEDEPTLEHLGVNLIQVGRCREAVDVLAQLALLNPQCEAAYCYRILAHAMLDEHDQAEQMFYMARLLRDECPRCYEHIAQSLAAREMLDKAIWCWQRVLRLEHEHPDANLHLAHLLWQRGQRQRARMHFLEQIHREPHAVVEGNVACSSR